MRSHEYSGVLRNWFTKERKIALTIALIGLIYFLLAVNVLMPAFGGGLLRFDRYAHLGGTPGEVLNNVFKNPSLLVNTLFNKHTY